MSRESMATPHAISPTSDEVHNRLLALQRKHPDHVAVTTVATTAEGRPIDAAYVTDVREDDADKQHVLIVAGQHGNEESARLVALRLIDYLLSSEGRPLLKKQTIVVMPNVSPDAAERDAYETPAGIKPNLDHGSAGPQSPEGKAVQIVADQLMPEVYVDIHARGHAGWSHDMVLFPAAKAYTEDEHLLHTIASAMATEGEKSGIPHVVHPLSWPGWGTSDLDQPSSTMYMYRRFKSLVFLTENAEHNDSTYPEKVRAASGVNRLKPLLAMGNVRHPKLYYRGYPCAVAVGMFHAGVVAVGTTAAARRLSRVDIWSKSGGFRAMGPVFPEKQNVKTLQVDYDGPSITAGIGFQVRVAGRWLVRGVRVNGKKLKPSETHGYYTWHDKHTTYIVAALPTLEAGKHELIFTVQ